MTRASLLYNGKVLRIGGKLDFNGENFRLLTTATKGCHTHKFCRENFREYPQNLDIHDNFLPR